jgi:hypothetical protein
MTTFAILLEERLFYGKNYEEPGAEMVTFMHWTITELCYYSGTLFTFTATIFWYTCKNENNNLLFVFLSLDQQLLADFVFHHCVGSPAVSI